MEVASSQNMLQQQLTPWQQSGTMGLVATMGNLHAGHMALLATAKATCDKVICSIFVNPLQFNKTEDYQNYPRTRENDIKKANAAGCDLLFCPSKADIYPHQPRIKIDCGPITEGMEGTGRPGHFNGVAIILSRLFHITQPTHAYFGEKDWQQCLLAQQLVTDLAFPIKIVTVPTVREDSGLARSSRNERLSATQRKQATQLHAVLQDAATKLQLGQHPSTVQDKALAALRQAPGIYPEYFQIIDSYSLQDVKSLRQHKSVSLCLAAKVGPVRLIDNLRIQP